MTVYVDDMFRYPMGRHRRMKMSHMVADTDEELHAMAQEIGVKREWFQEDHYDISLNCRSEALHRGAIFVPMKILAAMMKVRLRTGRLPKPAEVMSFSVKMSTYRLITVKRSPR